jgi:hypothetical protein
MESAIPFHALLFAANNLKNEERSEFTSGIKGFEMRDANTNL